MRNQRKSQNYPNNSMIKTDKNTMESTGVLEEFAVTKREQTIMIILSVLIIEKSQILQMCL